MADTLLGESGVTHGLENPLNDMHYSISGNGAFTSLAAHYLLLRVTTHE